MTKPKTLLKIVWKAGAPCLLFKTAGLHLRSWINWLCEKSFHVTIYRRKREFFQVIWRCFAHVKLACEQALWGALEFEFHLLFSCGSASTELSDFCQSAQRRNERECKQTLKNMCQARVMIIVSNVISVNQHFAPTFSMQIFKFQRHSCKLYFLFSPCHQIAPGSLLAG